MASRADVRQLREPGVGLAREIDACCAENTPARYAALVSKTLLNCPFAPWVDGVGDAVPVRPGSLGLAINRTKLATFESAHGSKISEIKQSTPGQPPRVLNTFWRALRSIPISKLLFRRPQRIAVAPVAELELTFEVGTPQIIGCGVFGERRAARTMARPPPRLTRCRNLHSSQRHALTI